MANEGMPQHNFPSQHGALFVKYIVDLPAQLTAEQKKGLEAILK
jgi:DnaJ-class molecular chaperone